MVTEGSLSAMDSDDLFLPIMYFDVALHALMIGGWDYPKFVHPCAADEEMIRSICINHVLLGECTELAQREKYCHVP